MIWLEDFYGVIQYYENDKNDGLRLKSLFMLTQLKYLVITTQYHEC